MDKGEFKNRRQRIGLSQGQIADLLGLSASTISKYEMGINEVPKYFEFIFEALDARHIEKLKSKITISDTETLKENPASGLKGEN